MRNIKLFEDFESSNKETPEEIRNNVKDILLELSDIGFIIKVSGENPNDYSIDISKGETGPWFEGGVNIGFPYIEIKEVINRIISYVSEYGIVMHFGGEVYRPKGIEEYSDEWYDWEDKSNKLIQRSVLKIDKVEDDDMLGYVTINIGIPEVINARRADIKKRAEDFSKEYFRKEKAKKAKKHKD